MKKYLSFIVTIMLIILGFSYSVYAAEDIFELNVKSQTTNLHRGDEITLPIMLENINVVSGEQGVAVVQGTLSYEKEVFEVVKFEATNFELMANDDMIVSNSKDGYVVKQNTEIGKVTLKVNDDAKYGNTELSFINITGAIPNSISGRSTALKLNITEVVQPTAVTLTDIIISKNPNKTEKSDVTYQLDRINNDKKLNISKIKRKYSIPTANPKLNQKHKINFIQFKNIAEEMKIM